MNEKRPRMNRKLVLQVFLMSLVLGLPLSLLAGVIGVFLGLGGNDWLSPDNLRFGLSVGLRFSFFNIPYGTLRGVISRNGKPLLVTAITACVASAIECFFLIIWVAMITSG